MRHIFDEIVTTICQLSPPAQETVGMQAALHRVTFSDVTAVLPQPSFDESTRDGYVIPLSTTPAKGESGYTVVGEIPAGKPYENALEPGTACRIMTGGCVPAGGARIIPSENCLERDGKIEIDNHFLQSTKTFIRKAGSEIAPGGKLVEGGIQLQPMHLALLASCGLHSVDVSRKPSVGYFCSGSELKSSSDALKRGEKVSSNEFLLQGLLTSFGVYPDNFGIIDDNRHALLELFAKAKAAELDLLVSTGGMGPGKYDLVKETFVEAGGEVFFTTLNMRPGKFVLVGKLSNTVFFGLPGPPHAAQTLLNILVGPALLAMQGIKEPHLQKMQAYSRCEIKVKYNDVLRLKDGVMSLAGGNCYVHLAGRFEVSNCYILLQPGQMHYPEGALVDIYLLPRTCTAIA